MKWILSIALILTLGCNSKPKEVIHSPITLEAQIINGLGGSKYHHYEIKIKKVITDSIEVRQGQILKVAILNTEAKPELNKTYILDLDIYNPKHPEYGYKIISLDEK